MPGSGNISLSEVSHANTNNIDDYIDIIICNIDELYSRTILIT